MSDSSNTTSPTFAVIIPVHNNREFLARTLQSVHTQTRPADEIIVVDDRSTDGSADLAREFGIEQVLASRDVGATAARNTGAAAALSDWLVFLDADDLWYPQRLERTEQIINSTTGSDDAILYHFDHVDPEGDEIHRRDQAKHPAGVGAEPVQGLTATDFLEWYASRHIFPGMSACAIKRQAWERVGGMDETQTRRHDLEIFFRLLSTGSTFSYDPCSSSAYRGGRAGNLSSNPVPRESFHLRALELNASTFEGRAGELMKQMLRVVALKYLGVAVTDGNQQDVADAIERAEPHLTGTSRWTMKLAQMAPGLAGRLVRLRRRLR